jgi:hypothetical protein
MTQDACAQESGAIRAWRARVTAAWLLGIAAAVAALFVALGVGFGVLNCAVFAVLVGLSAVITGSWSRTVLTVFVGFGLVATLLAVVLRIGTGDVLTRVPVRGFFVVSVVAAILVASLLIRRSTDGLDCRFRSAIPETAGMIGTALIGLMLAIKVDHSRNLLYLLLPAEDNEAWVRVQTRIAASPGLGDGLLDYGTSIATVIGYLTVNISSAELGPNAVWGVYALMLALSPSLLGGIVARIGQPSQRWFGVAVLALATLLFAGAFFRFAQYGHLTAILSLVALISVLLFVVEVEKSVRTTIAFFALIAFFAMCWFPFALFGIAALGYWIISSYREVGRNGRLFLIALCVLGIGFAALPVRFLLGNGVSGVAASLRDLYLIVGGTPQVDGFVLVLTLSGLVAFAFCRARLPERATGILDLALLLVVYGALAYGTGLILTKSVGYAQQKIAVIVVVSLMLIVITLLSSIRVDFRAGLFVVIAIVFGSLFIGGASDGVLMRTWPLGGQSPPWVTALSNTVHQQSVRGEAPHPVFCLTADTKITYDCYRWSQGLTGEQSEILGAISSAVFAGGDPAAAVSNAIASGEIKNLDVVVLDSAALTLDWQHELLKNANAVVGPDGKPLALR